MSVKVTISEDIYSPFVSACVCVCVLVWKSDSYSEIVWKLRSVDLPGGGKMMSKRQICIYRQTGILDLTAIQSLSACHVSPEGHPAFSQSSRFPCIRRSPISLPVSNSKAIVNQKEGQNKVSYLWMCQHGPSWNPAHTLSNEPDNSTGAFSSQEKWYLQKPLAGWNQNLCRNSGDTGGKALVNRIGVIQPN